MPDIELSSHTRDMLVERNIREEWLWRTLDSPDRKQWHVEDGKMHYTKAIKERDGHVLRVAKGHVVGIELLQLSTRTQPEKLRLLQFETV